jgi:hypothetical protein
MSFCSASPHLSLAPAGPCGLRIRSARVQCRSTMAKLAQTVTSALDHGQRRWSIRDTRSPLTVLSPSFPHNLLSPLTFLPPLSPSSIKSPLSPITPSLSISFAGQGAPAGQSEAGRRGAATEWGCRRMRAGPLRRNHVFNSRVARRLCGP